MYSVAVGWSLCDFARSGCVEQVLGRIFFFVYLCLQSFVTSVVERGDKIHAAYVYVACLVTSVSILNNV